MKLSHKYVKTPLFSVLLLIVVSVVTYSVITTYGFNFDSSLVNTTRAEIKGSPEDINSAVSEIYTKLDIINTDIGADQDGNQIQRLYFARQEEDVNTIKDIVGKNTNLTLAISDVTAGMKTDFSNELLSLLSVVCVFLIIINIALFRKIFDYQYTFLYTLLNIFTVLISVCVFLTGLSLMGYYGWHVSSYTLNMFVAFVFSVTAILVCMSLLFKEDLGDVEYISNAGEHFKKFISTGLKAYILLVLILILTFTPLLYFYYFRVEAIAVLIMGIFVSLVIRFAYIPVLDWYDSIRLSKTKFSKKKK